MKKIIFLFILFLFLTLEIKSQTVDSTSIYKKRKIIFYTTAATLYGGSMLTLYNAWYKNYEQSSFHWHNDNDNWQQMDKGGHALFAYYLSSISYNSLSWAGYDNKRSALIGSLTGFMFQTVIEILDGISTKWGASPGDLIANTTGSLLFASQQLLWKEQRINLKLSYHPTEFPQYQPNLLGSSPLESILKDYNGQTIWVSANIRDFIHNEYIPKWLNIALGYNAYGMTGAVTNPLQYNNMDIPHFNRTKKFVLSPDVNWTKIKTDKKWLQAVFTALNIIKFPAPSVEYDLDTGWHFSLIYF